MSTLAPQQIADIVRDSVSRLLRKAIPALQQHRVAGSSTSLVSLYDECDDDDDAGVVRRAIVGAANDAWHEVLRCSVQATTTAVVPVTRPAPPVPHLRLDAFALDGNAPVVESRVETKRTSTTALSVDGRLPAIRGASTPTSTTRSASIALLQVPLAKGSVQRQQQRPVDLLPFPTRFWMVRALLAEAAKLANHRTAETGVRWALEDKRQAWIVAWRPNNNDDHGQTPPQTVSVRPSTDAQELTLRGVSSIMGDNAVTSCVVSSSTTAAEVVSWACCVIAKMRSSARHVTDTEF
jgi:hypothetical protein